MLKLESEEKEIKTKCSGTINFLCTVFFEKKLQSFFLIFYQFCFVLKLLFVYTWLLFCCCFYMKITSCNFLKFQMMMFSFMCVNTTLSISFAYFHLPCLVGDFKKKSPKTNVTPLNRYPIKSR